MLGKSRTLLVTATLPCLRFRFRFLFSFSIFHQFRLAR